MYASNMTFEERVRLNLVPEEAQSFVDEMQQRLVDMEKELQYYKHREEALPEQVYFAKEVIENIQKGVNDARSVGQARQAVIMAIENGMFEL